MTSGWRTTTWGDVVTLQRGFDITKSQQVLSGAIPVVSSGGISSYHSEAMDTGPGVVIGRKGTLGKVHYIDGPFWPHDTTLWVKDFKGNDPRFVYYALRSLDPANMNVGSASPTLNRNHVHLLPVNWPILRSEQESIADVLSTLDDKIASNERHVRAIERLMLTLVEQVSGLVPLSELAVQSTAACKPADFANLVAHFSLPAYDDGARPEIAPASSIKSNKFVLSRPCVLFSKLNPRIPRIWNVPAVSQWMALASTEFVVLEPKGIDSSLLWAAASQPDVSVALQQKVAGTSGSHQRIKPAELLDVLVPDVRGLSAVESAAVGSLGATCEQCRTETQSLARIRDEILPLLMSGKVTVRAAEELVGDVT